MYDKALDMFIAVAETGSFSKAAQRLFLTHTAVIKQINGLEERLEVKLFIRSNQGIRLTQAGQVLYAESLELIKLFGRAVKKVQEADAAVSRTLRIGTSSIYPCHSFLDLWDQVRDQCPGFRLEVVSFQDDRHRLELVGREFDFVVGPYNIGLDDRYRFFPVGEYRFCLAVPRVHPLSRKRCLSFGDLGGCPLMIMRRGYSPVNDEIRREVEERWPRINIVDIEPAYDVSTFNQCVQRNGILLSLECWDRVHPDVRSIPLREDYRLPYGIVSLREPGEEAGELLKLLNTLPSLLPLDKVIVNSPSVL